MSQENPTHEELDAILQIQMGDYGVEPPVWWPVPTEEKEVLNRALFARWKHLYETEGTVPFPQGRQVIPAEAIEAAFEVSLRQLGLWGKELPGALENARRARITELLEAAAAHMQTCSMRHWVDAPKDDSGW